MKKIVLIIAATALTGGGFALGWIFAKKKYEGLADKEVESVKVSLSDYYEKKYASKTDISSEKKPVKKNSKKENRTASDTNVLDAKDNIEGYKDYSAPYRSDSDREDGKNELNEPYVITPEEFNESEYDTRTLYYYANRVLVNEDGIILSATDIRLMIGNNALDSFGLYEDDCVYVRNDVYRFDYEILKCDKEYEYTPIKGPVVKSKAIIEEDENK